MRNFLLGDADKYGRDTNLCLQGNTGQYVAGSKVAPMESASLPTGRVSFDMVTYNISHLHNLE